MVQARHGGIARLSVNMEGRNTLPEMADMHCVYGATGGNALTTEHMGNIQTDAVYPDLRSVPPERRIVNIQATELDVMSLSVSNSSRVHFDTSSASLLNEITTAIKVYAYGVEDFVTDPQNSNLSLNTQLSCEGLGDSRWKTGDRFFK
uniref:Uncharacterized protein n=1 Tax=Timema shepardi TaxID=629360 RepID=A0A7R9ASF1_TIMSH|nr:unnamed protein product [Timema shepardi]